LLAIVDPYAPYMSGIMRLLVLITLLAILASLGSALFHLSRSSPDSSRKMARALTVRIVLSIALFLLLMIAWYTGLIAPHGMAEPPLPPAHP
jgi:hypothetical protein